MNAHARFVEAGESKCACFMHVHGSQVGAGMHVVCMWQVCGSTSACCMHVSGVWERVCALNARGMLYACGRRVGAAERECTLYDAGGLKGFPHQTFPSKGTFKQHYSIH